jgi:RHS repeat-associated protein
MYDANGALKEFTSGGAALTTYMLDANGNRKSLTGPQGTDDYAYDPASNRLLRITGAHPKTYRYDDAGNVKSDGTNQFVYDGRGRLIEVTNAQGTTQYRINGLGQRVVKDEGAQTVSHFVYDEAGHLLGEYTLEGQPIQETVYLGDMPVAVLQDGATFFVYADHLDTPRAIANTRGTVVWRWDSDPFGAARPNEDPDGNRQTFTYNLRFPGQYFDQESGLMYNYFRDYDPQTGRYLQADPLGLAGGLNPYHYAEGNPLTNYDPYGLQSVEGSGNCGGSRGGQGSVPPGFVEGLRAGYLGQSPMEACAGGSGLGGFSWRCVAGNSVATAVVNLGAERRGGGRMPMRPGASPSQPRRPGGGGGAIGGAATSESRALVPHPHWPPDRGFMSPWLQRVLQPGTIVDRYGDLSGTFVSPAGTPFPMRSLLRPGAAADPPTRFEVLQPLVVRWGFALPWFGQPGLGVQYELRRPIQDLIAPGEGYLRLLP